MTRISIYIDGANFHYGCRSIKKKYSDFKFDFEKFIKQIIATDELVQAYYYNASLKQKPNEELFKSQQKFFARLRKINKFKVILCKRKPRTNEAGETFYTIKGDDIYLAIDMLKDAYENKYDKAILISGDGDFAPVVKYVRAKGKRVENYHFVDNISYDLIKECNNSTPINKKTLNKYFYREEQTTLADTPTGKALAKKLKK